MEFARGESGFGPREGRILAQGAADRKGEGSRSGPGSGATAGSGSGRGFGTDKGAWTEPDAEASKGAREQAWGAPSRAQGIRLGAQSQNRYEDDRYGDGSGAGGGRMRGAAGGAYGGPDSEEDEEDGEDEDGDGDGDEGALGADRAPAGVSEDEYVEQIRQRALDALAALAPVSERRPFRARVR